MSEEFKKGFWITAGVIAVLVIVGLVGKVFTK